MRPASSNSPCSRRSPGLEVLGAAALASLLAGCSSPPDGKYCECAKHGSPDRCVTLTQDGDNVEVEVTVDGKPAGKESVKYEVDSGYGRADTSLGPLEVSLGIRVLGAATSAHFKGEAAGPFTHTLLTRDATCQ